MQTNRPAQGTTSNLAVTRLVGKAERTFRKCWRFLVQLRGRRRTTFGEDLRDFQPALAEALLELSRGYQCLEQEQNALIARKAKLSLERFRQRMRSLEAKQKVIRRALSIGRYLGDGFAWLFYRDEPRLIEQHARHPGTPLLPTGVGGRGEVSFIRGVPKFQGYFVLYHGITSFLRVGDVSLISLNPFRVAALGELKTRESEVGKLDITLEIVSEVPVLRDLMPKSAQPLQPMEAPSASERDRRKRQTNRMGEAVTAHLSKKTRMNKKILAASLAKKVEVETDRLKPGEDTAFVIEPGHAIYAFRHRTRSLIRREGEDPDFTTGDRAAPLQRVALSISRGGDADLNRFHIAGVGYLGEFGDGFLFGTLPLFWWPTGLTFIRRIIFGETIVLSLLNSAHLTRALEAAGFNVAFDKNNGRFQVSQDTQTGSLQLGSFNYFLALIQYSLMPTADLVSALSGLRDEALRLAAGLPPDSPGIRLKLIFAQREQQAPS